MVKFTIDPIARLFIVKAGVIDVDVQIDLYSDAKEDWLSDFTLRKYRFPIRPGGGDTTTLGEFSPRYFFLREGWRIYVDGDIVIINSNLYVGAEDGGGSPFIIVNNGSVSSKNSDAGGIVGLTDEQQTALLTILADSTLIRQHTRNKSVKRNNQDGSKEFDIFTDDKQDVVETVTNSIDGLTRDIL